MYAQVVIGQEYLRLPANVERLFPLLLAVFLLAEATLVLAWRALPPHPPVPSRRLGRAAGVTLLGAAVFLLLGLHLPTMVTAWTDPASMVEYASSPTPFWPVKLMDLGIVVPAAVVVGLGVLRGAAGGVPAARLADLPGRVGDRDGRGDAGRRRPGRVAAAGGRVPGGDDGARRVDGGVPPAVGGAPPTRVRIFASVPRTLSQDLVQPPGGEGSASESWLTHSQTSVNCPDREARRRLRQV